jgi:hypothetical protein
MFKCIGLVTFETFVLVAALFVYIYTRKNDLSKWLQYLTASITIFVATLIVGTVFCCCMMCMGGGHHGGGRWHHGGKHGCNKGDMQYRSCDRNSEGCSSGNMGGGNCYSKGGDMDMDDMGDIEEKEIRIEIDADDMGGKDTIEKKVIIKKTR